MKVRLAGYNVDTKILKQIEDTGVDKNLLTPEILSAAYARISRSPLTVEELREQARQDVAKARKSNENIVFEMGHSSIAEHAVFNIDIEGVSRLILEEIEKHRLASYTEKSQRYVKFKEGYIVPNEIKNTKYEIEYKNLMETSFALYKKLIKEGVPKEDARYYLPLSTTSQLGITINARTLEHLILALSSSTFEEANKLAKKLYDETIRITPSLIRYVKPRKYQQREYELGFKVINSNIKHKINIKPEDSVYYEDSILGSLKLIDYTSNPDQKIAAIRLERLNGGIEINNELNKLNTTEIITKMFNEMTIHDPAPKELEHIYFTWKAVCSASAFAQLKRHRIGSITWSAYNPYFGFTHPVSTQNKVTDLINKTLELSEELFYKIHGNFAQYVLLSGHRKNVIFTFNLRELYHLSRLREDIHAQWDIRMFAHKMSVLIQEKAPISAKFLGGKNMFASKNIF